MLQLPERTESPAMIGAWPVNSVQQVDALDLLRGLPAGSVDAIITDPPYFGVKDDDWDNQWDSAEAFIAWIGTLCQQWRRVLASNGSLYVFASPRMAARVEVEISKHFNVLNHLIWRKEQARHKGSDIDALRGYFPQTERIIFAEQFGTDAIASGQAGYETAETALKKRLFGDYLDAEIARANATRKEISTLFPSVTGGLTGCVSNWVLGLNIPTPEQYQLIQDYLNAKGGDYLRREYDDLRRPFSARPDAPYTDVWDFKTVSAYAGKHPCEKPLALMNHIIQTSTRPGALILDCFAGSGATLDAARRLGRRFIGCDFDAHWAAYASKRVNLPYTFDLFSWMNLQEVG